MVAIAIPKIKVMIMLDAMSAGIIGQSSSHSTPNKPGFSSWLFFRLLIN